MIENPLLKPPKLPHDAVAFDLLKPDHFLPALDHAITLAKTRLDRIRQAPADFTATIEELECAGEEVDWIATIFYNLLGAETNEHLQKLAQEVGPKIAEYSSDLLLDDTLFKNVKAVYENRSQLDLTTEQDRLLESTYIEFVRNGALLNEEQKKRLREIDQRLSQLGPAFSENLLKSTNQFELYLKTPEEIAGLPEGVLEGARHAAEAKGRKDEYLFTLQAPSFLPFMQYGKHRHSREVIATALGRRAFKNEFDNQPLILEMVKLRHERACLLGYKNHAAFVLERRMAESPKQVSEFLKRLLGHVHSAAERDIAQVQEFAAKQDGIKQLQPWDLSFYSEKLKESLFHFNDEELRPYFKLENVVKGVFDVAKRLYDLEFEAKANYPVYHPDVQVFEVHQSRAGKREFIGLFYADFFPRASKRDGAWMTNFYEQGRFRGQVRRPHVSIVCNFTKPTPTKPSLLTLSEVETLFHEFGHSLHSLLSRCHYRTMAGTNVYWDFVELPSQIMENWVHEKQALDLFARHYETGATMPQELVEKIRASRKFMAGYYALRQLSLGFLDMAWYGQDPVGIQDVAAFEQKTLEPTLVLPRIPDTNQSCNFGHIFGGGYSAGYYSYKWAEVLDADAFEFFKEKGIFDKTVAEKFERHVLSRGGSEHPAKLYRDFRGRDPDPDALLRRDGLM